MAAYNPDKGIFGNLVNLYVLLNDANIMAREEEKKITNAATESRIAVEQMLTDNFLDIIETQQEITDLYLDFIIGG